MTMVVTRNGRTFPAVRDFLPNLGALTGLDIVRGDHGYSVEIPVPGFAPEHISVTLEDRILSVKGEGDKRQFDRTMLVPEEVDSNGIEARVEHGLLTLTLPFVPKAQPKKIDIKVV
jgi:HSP20 family protein